MNGVNGVYGNGIAFAGVALCVCVYIGDGVGICGVSVKGCLMALGRYVDKIDDG